MRDENYIMIQGWMVNKLHLKGNELLCYALVYGFSQDGESEFSGSAQYVADWLNISKRSALDILNKLTEKRLLYKTETYLAKNIKVCSYKTLGGEKTSSVGEKTSPNNIVNNIDNNYNSSYEELPTTSDSAVLDTKTKKVDSIHRSNKSSDRYSPKKESLFTVESDKPKKKMSKRETIIREYESDEQVVLAMLKWIDNTEKRKLSESTLRGNMKKLNEWCTTTSEKLEFIDIMIQHKDAMGYCYLGFFRVTTPTSKSHPDANMNTERVDGFGVSSGIKF